MAMRRFWPFLGCFQPRTVIIGGTVTIGSSGAIADQTGARRSGGTVTQTGSEDGRYHVAFDRTYKRAQGAGATMFGPADAAFPTATGSTPQGRNLAVTGFDVQFVRPDTQADADPASGTVFTWWAMVSTV